MQSLGFGRVYSLHLKSQTQSYFFKTELIIQGKLNPQTGMSVDLVAWDTLIHKILNGSKKLNKSKKNLIQAINSVYHQIKKSTIKMRVKLKSLTFQEERGFGIQFLETGQVLIYRTDFGVDKKKSLYRIVSYFDQKGSLHKTKLFNLDLSTTEVIFPSEAD